MDIPRTYLAEVAVAALAKVGKTEPHPLEVEQAIVDLQGVMNVIANGAAELITTPFEQAAVEALAEIPLNEWIVKWRQSVKESEPAPPPQPPPDDAPPDDAPPAEPTTKAKAKNK